MIPFNFHHLFYFYTIAQEGSVSAAAQKLRLSQPTLSAQLKQFEDRLGLLLFLRKGRSIELSGDGQRVLSYAKAMFDIAEEFVANVSGAHEAGHRRLSIGVSDYVPRAFVDALIKFTYELYDGVYIKLIEDSTERLVAQLDYHAIELVISDTPYEASGEEGIVNHLVGHIPVVFCAHPSLAKKCKKLPEGLNGQPMVMPTSPSRIYHAVNQYLVKYNVKPKIMGELQDVELVRRLVLAGMAIAPLNQFTVINAPVPERLTVLQDKRSAAMFDSIYLITKKRAREHLLLKKVLDQFQQPWKMAGARSG